MAPATSIRPASSTSNKENVSIFDDGLFDEFVDGDQFDFSDSSYARSASAASGGSWFDEPDSGPPEVTGSPPSPSLDVDGGNKTFVLDTTDDPELFPIDPLLDATAQNEAPSTPARADIGLRKLPSTVETVRRSQSCGVKRSDRRRRGAAKSSPAGSPTMSQPTSRRAQKEAWANQPERSIDPQALHSPVSNRYMPMSPPPTITQNRYQQQQMYPQQRLMSHSSLVSPLSQGLPAPSQQPYFSPLPTPMTSTSQTYPQQPMSSFYQPLNPYLSTTAASPDPSFPNFSNPFADADTAWEHDPILSSMNTDFASLMPLPSTSNNYSTFQGPNNLFNDTKVQPWLPPIYLQQNQHNMPQMPMSAPLASTQHQYYTNNNNSNHNIYPNPPLTAQPTYRSAPPIHPHRTTYPAPPALLAVPKTRRRDRRSPQPESDHSDSDLDITTDSDLSDEEDTGRRRGTSRSGRPHSPYSSRSSKSKHAHKSRSKSKSKNNNDTSHDSRSKTRRATSSYATHDPRSPSRTRSHRHTSKATTSSLPLSLSLSQSPTSPRATKHKHKHSKKKSTKSKDPFINLTAHDSAKILTGVAPSGSSKTKAKREREEAEKRREFSERARAAVRMVGGDEGVLEGCGF